MIKKSEQKRPLAWIAGVFAVAAAASSMAARSTSQSTTIPEGASPPGVLTPSVLNEAYIAIDRGLNWLAAHQKADGSWSDGRYPALTALPLWAFVRGDHPDKAAIVKRAVAYILSCQQPDGGIYREIEGRKGGGLSNYNTAICMTVLHETGDAAWVSVILRARQFIAGSQFLGAGQFHGGMGYDAVNRRAYTDMLNTYYAAEGMRLTAGLEDRRPKSEKRVDLDWAAAMKFVGRLQNDTAAGEDNEGGFVYNRVDPKAGSVTNASGEVVFRSYGSITSAGLLTMLYANVALDDARVKSAFAWASRHWTLKENPGMGQRGRYFFYNVLTKALTAYGLDSIKTPAGGPLDWRRDMVNMLISLQIHDADTGHGYWVNTESKYMEGDAVLTTAYTLLALEIATSAGE